MLTWNQLTRHMKFEMKINSIDVKWQSDLNEATEWLNEASLLLFWACLRVLKLDSRGRIISDSSALICMTAYRTLAIYFCVNREAESTLFSISCMISSSLHFNQSPNCWVWNLIEHKHTIQFSIEFIWPKKQFNFDLTL